MSLQEKYWKKYIFKIVEYVYTKKKWRLNRSSKQSNLAFSWPTSDYWILSLDVFRLSKPIGINSRELECGEIILYNSWRCKFTFNTVDYAL